MHLGSNFYRSSLSSRAEQPAELGARHSLVYDVALQDLLEEVDDGLKEILPDAYAYDERGREKVLSPYKLFDDPDLVGSTVVEGRSVRKESDKYRVHWSARDVGALAGEITDKVQRLRSTNDPIEVVLSGAFKVGVESDKNGRRKIAGLIDPECEAGQLFVEEHQIVLGGIANRIANFQYPFDYLPKVTFARLGRHVSAETVDECVGVVSDIIGDGRTLTAEDLRLYSGSREL